MSSPNIFLGAENLNCSLGVENEEPDIACWLIPEEKPIFDTGEPKEVRASTMADIQKHTKLVPDDAVQQPPGNLISKKISIHPFTLEQLSEFLTVELRSHTIPVEPISRNTFEDMIGVDQSPTLQKRASSLTDMQNNAKASAINVESEEKQHLKPLVPLSTYKMATDNELLEGSYYIGRIWNIARERLREFKKAEDNKGTKEEQQKPREPTSLDDMLGAIGQLRAIWPTGILTKGGLYSRGTMLLKSLGIPEHDAENLYKVEDELDNAVNEVSQIETTSPLFCDPFKVATQQKVNPEVDLGSIVPSPQESTLELHRKSTNDILAVVQEEGAPRGNKEIIPNIAERDKETLGVNSECVQDVQNSISSHQFETNPLQDLFSDLNSVPGASGSWDGLEDPMEAVLNDVC